MLKKFFKDQSANILIISAIAMVTIIGMAVLAIDVGYIGTARAQLQADVDAAALAGASGLITSQTLARARAIHFAGQNTCINNSVVISSADVTFPAANRIRVEASMPLNLFFAPVLGRNTTTVRAVAIAEIDQVTGTDGLAPLMLPDKYWTGDDWYEDGDPDDLDYPLNTPVVIKPGSNQFPSQPSGWYFPVDYPPLNTGQGSPETGGDVYRENLTNGCDAWVNIGDELLQEPGNMIGPTQQGVTDLIAQDPNAYWDGTQVVSSFAESPRIMIIPFYSHTIDPTSGRVSLTVVGLGAFFILDMQGQDLRGLFIKLTTTGDFGNGASYLSGVKLVQ